MPRKIRFLLVTLAVLLALALVSLLVFRPGSPPARPPLPNPNGYNDFAQASQVVIGNPSDYSTLDAESLRTLVSTNAEALRLLRLGLTKRCALPLDSNPTGLLALAPQLSTMKRLVSLLAAEGRLLELDQRPGEAAHSYVQAIQFGNELSRGGVLIHRLVGIAGERVGCSALARLVPKLGTADAHRVITELEKIDATHVTWAETVENEKYYVRVQLRGYYNPAMRLVNWWNTRRILARSEPKHKAVLATEHLLAAELALRCWQAEGRPMPTRLEELVPHYLARVPVDPFTAQPLVYQLNGTNWLLHTVSPAGGKDGANPGSGGSPPQGELHFNSP